MFDVKLDEKILENNTICVFGTIDEEMTKRVLKQILALQFKFKEECVVNPGIVVLINSSGGLVTCGLAICDALRALNCNVATVCVGSASSMASILLSSGTKGKRYALPNSEIMIHQPLGGAQGQASDIKIQADHIIKTKHRLNTILAQNSGKPYEQVEKDTERDFYMTPSEALKYGLIDKILTNGFAEVYNEILHE